MNNQRSLHPVLRIAAATLLIGVMVATGVVLISKQQSSTRANTGQLSVVAAENFWGNIASQVGGTHVHVTSIISDPSADPHLYESSASNAQVVDQADVVITNGLGYDDFMDKLLGTAKRDDRIVLRAADVLQAKDGATPHLWYDIPRVHEVADKMADSFAAKDGAHAAEYRANARKFTASLQPLIDQLDQLRQQAAGQAVAYTEPVPAYLLDAAGLRVASPAGFSRAIEDGTDPSPADTQAMDALFSQRSVKALLYNSQATSELTQKVQDNAEQNGVPVIGVTETLPTRFKTYQDWQLSQLDALRRAVETQ